jgi:hypothetical protein
MADSVSHLEGHGCVSNLRCGRHTIVRLEINYSQCH